MKNASRKIKRLSIALLIIVIIAIGSLYYLFVANDTPIIHGKVIFNQEYKENLTLDIYMPTQVLHNRTPVVIFIHGGAWIGGRKGVVNVNRFNDVINQLREHGYAVISTNYTLAKRNKSPVPDCILDIYETIKWVKNNSDQYRFDIDNIGLFGASAGAHIAMMAAYANPENFGGSQVLKTKINYVVNAYGPTDLDKLYHMQTIENFNVHIETLPEGLRKHLDIAQHLFGFDPEQDTAKAQKFIKKYSPINYLNQAIPPTLIIHGDKDQIVPVEQSILLNRLLDSLSIENELHLVAGVNHAFRGASKEQKQEIQTWILDFIERHYHHPDN